MNSVRLRNVQEALPDNTPIFALHTIARSTIPLHHLAGLAGIVEDTELSSLAEYNPNTHRIRYIPGETSLRPSNRLFSLGRIPGHLLFHEDVAMNIIHEIGHHVDDAHTHSTTKKAVALRIPVDWTTNPVKGLSEGFADRYMLTHYRQDEEDARKHGPYDPTANTYHGRKLAKRLPTYYKGLGLEL